jgi:hypothetical protein
MIIPKIILLSCWPLYTSCKEEAFNGEMFPKRGGGNKSGIAQEWKLVFTFAQRLLTERFHIYNKQKVLTLKPARLILF